MNCRCGHPAAAHLDEGKCRCGCPEWRQPPRDDRRERKIVTPQEKRG